MNNLDLILENLPFTGIFFQRTYTFWRMHIGIANITHVIFGIGLALAFVSSHKKLGILLVALAMGMHVIAFIMSS